MTREDAERLAQQLWRGCAGQSISRRAWQPIADALQQAHAAGVREGLEMAARECERQSDGCGAACARVIRTLAVPTQEPPPDARETARRRFAEAQYALGHALLQLREAGETTAQLDDPRLLPLMTAYREREEELLAAKAQKEE